MRVTQQLLRSKASGPLQSVEYLDLSNLGLVTIEKLTSCPKLQTLNLRGNNLSEVTNLEHNRHLWKLDLSNNEIKDVDCLSKFIALGTLNLANNDLSWHDIAKLRHLHILELCLHGNQQLEKDPYYRIHVIDSLPNVWMLDGRIITSAERLQVKRFFADSALSDHPIRRKMTKEWFVPSSMKKIEVNGVYGEKATHLMTRFPANGPCNIDTDKKRLKYLAFNAQEDLVLEKKYTKRDFQILKYRKAFVEDILDIRTSDRERCNMLMLLLVSTLEFVMPTHLVKETLEDAKLSKLGKVYTMDLFLLPKDVRCHLVCILLGAIKIDKDSKEDGGLYDKLYLCLFYTVAELSKLSNSIGGRNLSSKPKMSQLYRDYKCLLASEVVQLLCIVPAFFEYIDKDVGVMNLVVTATGDTMITEKVSKLSQNIRNAGGDIQKLYQELSDFLLQKVHEQSMNLTNRSYKLPQDEQVVTGTKSIPLKSSRSPLEASDFHAKGITSPSYDPPTVLSARAMSAKVKRQFPHLGDYLLLGPQMMGKIIGLPQPFLAQVAMDAIPVTNGAMETRLKQSEDHYTYVNMDQLDWDVELGFWKPKGSIGDSILEEFLAYSNSVSRFTIHTIEDLRKELNRRANVSGDVVPRPNSPEETSRAFAMTPGRDTATPLIFSTGSVQSYSDDSLPKKYQQNDFTPRPMTSLLKEKLNLKLDFTPRRAQSAGAVEGASRSSRSPRSPRNSPENKSVSEKGGNLEVDQDGKAAENLEKPADCVHCAIAAGINQEQVEDNKQGKQTEKDRQGDDDNAVRTQGETDKKTNKTSQLEGQQANESQPSKDREADKENEEPDTGRTTASLAQSENEPELQDLITSRTDRPASEPNGRPQPPLSYGIPRQGSSLQINIPQVELMDDQDEKVHKGKVPTIKGRAPPMSSRSQINGRMAYHAAKNRPFSAMDAYRYIVNHPRKPIGTEHIYNTSYQQQRMEAWRKSASTSVSTQHTPTPPAKRLAKEATSLSNSRASVVSSKPSEEWAFMSDTDSQWTELEETLSLSDLYSRQGTPPPQRPTSPENKSRPSSGLAVKKANDWLGGGRDLYWESIQNRPRSGHIPGWKEGLPDSMKRPRSAVASRTLNRQSRRATPVTPSSLAYEAMMQGGSRGMSPRGGTDPSLPNMIELSEYPPLYQHLGLPRRLGSSGSLCSQEFAQQTPETVYRNPRTSPIRQVAQSPRSYESQWNTFFDYPETITEEFYSGYADSPRTARV